MCATPKVLHCGVHLPPNAVPTLFGHSAIRCTGHNRQYAIRPTGAHRARVLNVVVLGRQGKWLPATQPLLDYAVVGGEHGELRASASSCSIDKAPHCGLTERLIAHPVRR